MRAQEFTEPTAAGIVLYAEDTGRWGLQQRSDSVNDPGLWAAWGGGREPGESLEQCARRELAEESGYRGPIRLESLAKNAKYVTFIGVVPHEFEPRPCDEWKDYCWTELGKWPGPMHPGTAAALENVYIKEAFDQPYKTKTEKSDYGDVDMLARLPDGTNLSIMFNKQQNNDGEETIQVEFYRNNSQEVTGEGDAQRIFATVLTSIQKYIKKYKPARLSFSASKATDPTVYYEPDQPQPNPESRAKLYDRLVQRYSKAWGYRAFRADTGDLVIYELSRLQPVAENFADGRNPQDKGDSKRHGVPTKASVSTLRKVAKQGGRKGQLAHWMANMKAGKKKANEDKEIYNYPKLDRVLDRCIKMIFDGHKKDPEKYGKVAACLIDDQNRHTYAINLPGPDGTRRHAERMAIDKHIQRYGSVGNNAIMVTTLSPCVNHMSERYGESCTDLLTEFNIEKCYAGWQDPTQQPETALPFNLEVTDNAEIFNTCKDIALTFLPGALA